MSRSRKIVFNKDNSICLFLHILITICVLSQIKTYVISYQVVDAHEIHSNPFRAFSAMDPHALRYLLMYPILLAEEISGVGNNALYSIVVLIAYLGTNFTNRIVVDEISEVSSSRKFYKTLVCLFYTLLFLVMSGRLPIAIFGYSLIVAAILLSKRNDRWCLRTSTLSIAGVLLCSVTSGVFLSAIIVLLGSWATSFLYGEKDRSYRLLSSVLLVFLIFNINIANVLIGTNSHFGDGIDGLVGMFSHGYGDLILDNIWTLFVISAIAAFLGHLFLTRKLRIAVQMLYPLLITMAAVCLGAFGYSALVMAVVPGFLLGLVIFDKAAGNPARNRAKSV